MNFEHSVETGLPIPPSRAGVANFRSVDFSSVVHGSSVLVVDRKKAYSVRSCLNHYKKRNPDKLVGFKCITRKEGGKYRVFFVNPDLL
jgi:hypothetical protein